ncbi:MAG: ABC transporter ATP-binding protein [Deltaproteobacteria bacterium]|nr:ABC transporter ATP-binding protein [Deltaproteobacteria bacterium]
MFNNQSIIEIRHLSKSYKSKEGKIEALQELTLQINQGEIIGLLGQNGAGKTTAVKLVMGFLSPTEGDIFFQGKKLNVAAPRKKIGYLPESFQPNPNLTVYEYIQFLSALSGSENAHCAKDDIMDILKQVGMNTVPNRMISDLSKGMIQRVGLAQAFAGDPDLLILDEPTSGLDPIGKTDIIDFLLAMKQQGKTIFFCSHILSEVERLCDRIGILAEGRLRFLGSVKEFLGKWGAKNLEDGFKLEVQCATSSPSVK